MEIDFGVNVNYAGLQHEDKKHQKLQLQNGTIDKIKV